MADLDAVTAVARPRETEALRGGVERLHGVPRPRHSRCEDHSVLGERQGRSGSPGPCRSAWARPSFMSSDRGRDSTGGTCCRPRAAPEVRAVGRLRMTGSGGQRRVPAAFLTDLQIPLPPLDEQRRIAAILAQSDAVCAEGGARRSLISTPWPRRSSVTCSARFSAQQTFRRVTWPMSRPASPRADAPREPYAGGPVFGRSQRAGGKTGVGEQPKGSRRPGRRSNGTG